jgi:hypothetical protein
LGGIAIGDYFQPHALGEGYDAIEGLLHGDFPPTAVISLLVVKLLIWTISLGPVTLGGVLAPLLMMGAGQGAVESTLLAGARPLMWPLVSTGGVLAGVMRSPAHRYCKFARVDAQCCLPAAASECVHRDHAFSVLVMTRSILTEIVARCGFHIFREGSVDATSAIFVEEDMGCNVVSIPDNALSRQSKTIISDTQPRSAVGIQ